MRQIGVCVCVWGACVCGVCVMCVRMHAFVCVCARVCVCVSESAPSGGGL